MPWKIIRSEARCSASKPYAVVAADTGRTAGCHASRASAIRQQRALYASDAASDKEGNISDITESLAEAVMEEQKNGNVAVIDEVASEEEAIEALTSDELNIPVIEEDPIAWSGPIALEGVPTGDSGMKRYLMPGSLGWRDLPMTLMAQFKNEDGHEGAEVAGRIDHLRRDDSAEVQAEFGEGVTVIWAEGVFDTGEAGQEAARMVGDQIMSGISVDLTDSVWKLRDPEDNSLFGMNELPEELHDKFFAGELQIALESGKIGAATIVPIPALEDASVQIASGAIVFSPQPHTTGSSLDAQIEAALTALAKVTQKERFEGYKLGLELGVLTQEDIFKAEGRELIKTPTTVEEGPEKYDPEGDKKRIILSALEAITERLAAGDKLNESMVSTLTELQRI